MNALVASLLTLIAVLLAYGVSRRRLMRLFGGVDQGDDMDTASGAAGSAAAGGVSEPEHDRGTRTGSVGPAWLPAAGASVLAGLAVVVVLGGPVGWLLGPGVGVVTFRVLRNAEPAAVRVRRLRMETDLPMTIDVFAACLAAGASPQRALSAIAAADPGPLGTRLSLVADQLREGADPRQAWLASAPEPGVAGLAFFERAMARAADSGIPLVAVLDRLADDVRAERRAAADRRARSVGVRAAAPLGLCFLPAFVLVGIVPMVVVSLRGVL